MPWNTALFNSIGEKYGLVPFFFMDLSKAEQVEVNALIKRYNHLLEIGEVKGCSSEREAIPDFEKADY